MKIRPSLFNLIVYTDTSDRIEYYQEIVQGIIQKFPCRILFTQSSSDFSPTHLEIKTETITARDAEEGIACDQIEIEVGSACIERVPYILLSRLASDVPIYLLWGHDPTSEHAILPHILPFATHLIFDSETTDDLQAFSKRMCAKKEAWNCELVDMNWARFGGWRQVLCQAFDSYDLLKQLQHSDQVTLHYNALCSSAFQHCDTQARYFQSWIASIMNWETENSGEEECTYQFEGKPLQVKLVPEQDKVFSPGALIAMTCSHSGGFEMDLKRLHTVPAQVRAQITHRTRCDMPFTIPLMIMSRGISFIKQLLYTTCTPEYYTMLEHLAETKRSNSHAKT